MNIFRDWNTERHWSFRWLLAGLVVVCLVNAAQALDPNRAMSDYLHDRWGVEQGFPGGPIYAITQTPDGYLWLGTEKGLVRFDGFNFRPFNHTNSAALPAGPVLDLMTDAEGNLWIRPQSRNMLRYRNGTFQDVMPDLDRAHSGVTAMCLGPKGEALFAVRANGAFIYTGGRFEKLLSTAERPGLLVISMAETSDGKVWMGTRDAGLFYMSEGQLSAVTKGLPDRKINSLLTDDDRELWIGTDNGVVRWNGAEAAKTGPDTLDHIQAFAMTRDRESNIWLGTAKGLLRLNASGVSSLAEGGNESTGAVNTIFEDREGNLWIGRSRGIERLRDMAESFAGIQQELALQERIHYQVTIEGSSRPLHPLIRDEVYRIGREALVNASRHSRATKIEVILEYSSKQLQILVRDNGCGIDPQVLRSGRDGHWGLSGMRERTEEIGASLKVWSRAGAGTEVELSIPGDVAFESHSSEPRRWFAKLYPRTASAEITKAKKGGK